MLLGMAKYHHGAFWEKVDQFSRLPPLHFVLRTGDHPNVLENLIKSGQNINGVDCHGWTPLVWALLEERKESLELLLVMGRQVSEHAIYIVTISCISP
ncbi:hypothetical protein RRF57_013088 [Xylaria bambusicola]|uniref:Uncharacterized protein n=1 Tax=Xylaria bambusicola TaxID=326684 RepID=A0AAN7V1A5_9PEZI